MLADDATVGQPEIKLGVIPGAGGTQRLSRLVGPARTRDLVYSGRLVDAHEALAWGLADRVVAGTEVFSEAMADRSEVRRGPAACAGGGEGGHPARRSRPPGPPVSPGSVRSSCDLFGTPDQREGMRAFLDKRDPRFGNA